MDRYATVKEIIMFSVLGIIFIVGALALNCFTGESVRVDETKNKALENLTEAGLCKILLDKDLITEFRECMCGLTDTVKKSDANRCDSVTNINDSKSIIKVCKDFENLKIKSHDKCVEIFSRRK